MCITKWEYILSQPYRDLTTKEKEELLEFLRSQRDSIESYKEDYNNLLADIWYGVT